MRVFFREAFKLFLIFLRNSTFFIIENKMCTAYKDTFSLYTGRNTMSCTIYSTFECISSCSSPAFCRRYYCLRHRVRKMLFQTGRYTKQFIFTPASQNGTIIFTVGIAFVSVPVLSSTIVSASATASKKFSALYRNIIRACLTNCRQYRNRHCEF